MKKALSYIIPIAICFTLGFIASRLQTDALHEWYPYLNKPAFTPPDWLFPVAWSIIYLLSGISAGLIWNSTHGLRNSLLTLWGVQQLLNFIWSILFFTMRNPTLGFVNIVALDILVLWYIVRTWPVCRAASVMFWPYLVWIAFATYLNGYIMVMN
ncbi:MAG: tryptophan-rich sensory protein [Rikenellaceae bacterium]|nr:tryptophan-rich sensory protein [Rikenellaceae bacterium]